MRVAARCWFKSEIGDNTAQPVSDPLGCDQCITQAEGAQPGGISGVAFRPVGGTSDNGILNDLETGCQLRNYGTVSLFFKPADHMAVQFKVELLAVAPVHGPCTGWIKVFLAVAFAYGCGDGQYPADDGCGLCNWSQNTLHDFVRRLVKLSDDLFVIIEQCVICSGKANQRRFEIGLFPLWESIERALLNKVAKFAA